MSKTFFGREKSIGKLQLDLESTNASSEQMLKRLGRIEENYGRLEFMLGDLESRLADDVVHELIGRSTDEQDVESLPLKPR